MDEVEGVVPFELLINNKLLLQLGLNCVEIGVVVVVGGCVGYCC